MKNFAFILLGCFAFALCACSNLAGKLIKDPEVKVADVKVEEIHLTSIKLAVKLNVLNPNPVDINLDKIDYVLKIAGSEVTKGSMSQGVSLPAQKTNQVIVPLVFSFDSAGQALRSILGHSDSKTYEVTGNAKFGIFTIPFDKKGEIKLN